MRGNAAVLTVVMFLALRAQPSMQGPPSPPLSALPLRLTGVAVDSERPARSACLVACGDQAGRSRLFFVGDRACDSAEILAVQQDGVVIRNLAAGRMEFLAFTRAAARSPAKPGRPNPAAPDTARTSQSPLAASPAAPPDTLRVVLDKAVVQQAVSNLPALLDSALAAPRFKDGAGSNRTIDGYELSRIREASLISQIGLQDGDVVVAVNGEPVDGPAGMLKLFGQLQSLTGGTLTVLRDGRRMTITIATK